MPLGGRDDQPLAEVAGRDFRRRSLDDKRRLCAASMIETLHAVREASHVDRAGAFGDAQVTDRRPVFLAPDFRTIESMNAEQSVVSRAADSFLVDDELDELQWLGSVKLSEFLSVNVQQHGVRIVESQSNVIPIRIDGRCQDFCRRLAGPRDFHSCVKSAEFVSSANGNSDIAPV